MQALRRTASVVLFPTIACLVAACEHSGLPTEPQSTVGVVPPVNDATFSGVVWWVNDDASGQTTLSGGSCNNPSWNAIQDAVNAAASGDRINVCPGTYTEQVTITTGKDNLQLRSTKRWQAVIQAPPTMAASDGEAIVRVEVAQNVTILAFTITGPGNGYCGSIGYGIRVNDASANILGNHITDIRDKYDPITGQPSGCQNGWGVVVGQRYADPELSTASATIDGNVIERYQKDGVVVGGADSHAEITANRVLGIGRTTKIAQNGIEVLYATAGIKHNFVANNNYTPGTPTTDESTGILLYQSGNVATEHNTVAANGVGVYVFDAGAGSTTTKNHIRAGNNDGVAVDCSANCSVGSHVVDNKIEHNAGPGIGLYNGVQGNTIDDNQVKDNSNDFGNIPCTTAPPPPTPPCGGGIVLDDADGNIISNNHIKNNGTLNTVDNTDGIRVKAASNGNNIHDNHLKKNLTHDCHDDATPGSNTWTNNKGKTSMQVGPAPLCSQDDDDTFEAESAYGWDPSYPWYASFDSAADPDLDFATAYVGIDTDSILQLLPSIRLGSVLKRNVSP